MNMVYFRRNDERRAGTALAIFTKNGKQKELTDADKLEALYLTYRQLMFYVAYTILHDIPAAEDAVQQAFLRAMNHLEKISGVDCPQTKNFLVIIVKNIALNLYNARRKRNTVSFDEVEGWLLASPRDELHDWEASQQLEDLMERLPESYRDALMLRYDNGYTAAEIASLLQISEENAKKRLQRARAKLAQLIAEGEVG